MFSVRLAGGHLYGKQLFTWLSLVVSFVASFVLSFVLSFFPLDVLDGIWDLIESVSEGLLTYSGTPNFVFSGNDTFSRFLVIQSQDGSGPVTSLCPIIEKQIESLIGTPKLVKKL